MKRSESFHVTAAACAAILSLCSLARGKVIYVDDDANAPGDGSSWETAYRFLQDALADAESAEKPVEVRVAQGIYRPDQCVTGTPFPPLPVPAIPRTPSRKQAAFVLHNGVTLRGGYAGLDAVDPNGRDVTCHASVLSGDLDGDDNDLCPVLGFAVRREQGDNAYHVLYSSDTDGTAVLDGFFITGATNGALFDTRGGVSISNCTFTKNVGESGGGAIWSIRGDLSAIHCTFSQNLTQAAEGGGGGAIFVDYGMVTCVECRFLANSAPGSGGALRVRGDAVLIECRFQGNQAQDGGAIWSWGRLSLQRCRFVGNASRFGGAISTFDEVTMGDCTFHRNQATAAGGGLHGGGVVTVAHSTFSGNAADWGGGALDIISGHMFLTNTIFAGNRTGGRGGAIVAGCHEAFVSLIRNCTFSANSSAEGNALFWGCQGGGGLAIVNSILWDEGNEITAEGPHCVRISYSNIEEQRAGEGNANRDPCFVDPGYWDPNGTPDDPNDDFFIEGDWHLKSQAGRWDPISESWIEDDVTSPCIDAGDPMLPIGHEPFPNGGRVNMGAYGGTVAASKSYFGEPVCETIIAGDINGDCCVDWQDLAILSRHWLADNRE